MTIAPFGQHARRAGAFIAVFGLVAGARLWVIDRSGSQVPILDQWDAEGAFLLKPFVEGSLRLTDLFAPHNEHRLVLTRLWSLLLFVLNGQWDPFLEIVANAVLVAFVVSLFALAVWRLFQGPQRGLAIGAVTICATLPYGFENTVWGFQSSFYFLIFLSLTAIWTLGRSETTPTVLAVGALSALAACFTIASGFLCAVAVLFLILLRVLTKRATLRQIGIVAAIAVTISFLGWLLRAPAVRHHIGFAAPSFTSWILLFARCVAWPFCDFPPLALVMYLPLIALGITYLKRRGAGDDMFAANAGPLLGIGIWVVLQAAAISYGRAGHEARVVSRYMDVLAVGAVANFFALLVLLRTPLSIPIRIPLARFAAIAWSLLALAGAAATSMAELRYEHGRRAYMDNAVIVARAFVATHDKQLLSASALTPIPYPNADRIAALLDDSIIQRLLPPAIRPPLQLEPATKERAFTRNALPPQIGNQSRERVWGSYSAEGVRATGTFRSKPFLSHLPYLELEIAGYLRPGLSLMVDDVDGGIQHRVIPTQPIDQQWRAAYVGIPEGAHTIAAEDSRADQWFAFREPRECGRLSYWALRLARLWPPWVIGGTLLLLVVLLWKRPA